MRFSQVVSSRERAGDILWVRSLALDELGERTSPINVLDHFRVRGRPFSPHPHAGFSTISYVFEDSTGGLRSRDSLGNDFVMGPGGIVWTEAGRGVIHEELPAEAERELHGIQLFVNLSSRNKLVAPRVLRLAKSEVPEWQSDGGDRVRVLVGSFRDLSSPLVPIEPFEWLEIWLRRGVSIDVRETHNTLVYLLGGEIVIRAGGREQKLASEQAVALQGSGRVALEAAHPAHVFVLSGAELREPVLARGPFIMNEPSQIEAAMARYRAGDMGRLSPLSES